MHVSAILVINAKGEVVISRYYRDDVSQYAANNFRLQVIAAKEAGQQPPIKYIDKCTFLYTRHEDIYFVAVTKGNVNPALVFQFLKNLIHIFSAYFDDEKKKFHENELRQNFTLVYELLDEVMDFGYPQTTSVDILQLHINTGEMRKDLADKNVKLDPKDLTGAVDWRRDGIRYKQNQIFIDVIESVELHMSANGSILRNEVRGSVMMKTELSGMPECKFGLNDKVSMEAEKGKPQGGKQKKMVSIDDCTFHRCVRLGKFEDDRSITFIPPDGQFELMKYRITQNIKLPFRVMPVVEEQGNKVIYTLKVKANFNHKLYANKVVFLIPTPPNTARCKVKVMVGRATHESGKKAIVWRIRKFTGHSEYTLRATVERMQSTSKKAWARPPITMEFQVPMFASSGMAVRFLKIYEKSSYKTTKWVRYITKSGRYDHRI